MNNQKDLTRGPIFKQLFRLALPIIGTSFMQMGYNMIDMIWLGRLGSNTVAAVGTAGFFLWLGISVLLTTKVGTEIGVSQAVGKKNKGLLIQTISNAFFLVFTGAISLGALFYLIAPDLIGFFNLKESEINYTAVSYLRIISTGALFYFSNPTISAVFNGVGNSKTPFMINSIGLITNIILDPILIFGFGPFPKMGANGAAWATIFSQSIVFLLLWLNFNENHLPVKRKDIFLFPDSKILLKITKLGAPVAAQSSLFAIFAMIIARITARWGAIPIAVLNIGAQIEALSWMTASGFATALGTFTGQNFGAKFWNRIRKGFRIGTIISASTGAAVTALFFFFGKPVFSLFIAEPDTLIMGTNYLHILAWSQIFMCLEITTSGAFYGIGRTLPPSLLGTIFTGLRIPLALLLSQPDFLDLQGIWWALSISSVFKGMISFSWFNLITKYHPDIMPRTANPKGFVQLIPTRIRQQIIGVQKLRSNS